VAAALVGIGLFALCVGFVAYGMAGIHHSQSQGFLGWIASQAVDTAKAAVWITEQIVPLTSFLLHELGKAYEATYSLLATWLGGVENFVRMSGAATYYFALAMNDWTQWLLKTELPRVIHGITTPVIRAGNTIVKRIQPIEKIVYRIPKLTKAAVAAAIAAALPGVIAHDIPYFDWLKKHLKALERILAGAAGAVIGLNIPSIKDLIGIRKRIGKLEKALTHKAAAALVVTALATLGLSWIRCTNWKRLGRGVCGLPSSVISDILGLITDVFILADICEVIKLTDSAFGVVEGPLASFVGNVGGALCHGDYPAQAWPGLAYSTPAPELNALAL